MADGSSNGCNFQMVDPTQGIVDQMQQMQQAMVDDKMGQAMNDLRQKAAGQGGRADRWAVAHGGNDQVIPTAKARFAGDDAGYMGADHPDAIAKAIADGKAALAQPIFRARSRPRDQEEEEEEQHDPEEDEEEDDASDDGRLGGSDDELDSDDDLLNDPELDKIRMKRLGQIAAASQVRQEQLAKGHGQYRAIVQDDFLKEVTGSDYTVCHFYHNDFERCKVIDHHLRILAAQHLECRFVRIDAEKTPFFVDKLKVQVLPTIICFTDGIANNDARIVGFDTLCDDLEPGKESEFKTEMLEQRLAEQGVIIMPEKENEDVEHEQRLKGSIYGGMHQRSVGDDEIYDD